MKTFNELYEHHDAMGNSWPSELLGMSLDELLDKLRKVDEEAYKEIEAIISRRIGDIVGDWATADDSESDDLPTFDEMGSSELEEIEARLKGNISPDTRIALMRKRNELLGGEQDINSFEF